MSSISGVSSTSSSSYLFELQQTKNKQRKANMDTLSTAIDSGDLKAAKTAFADIQKDMPGKTQGSSSGSSSDTGNNQMPQDFKALSDALNSGDLSAAKTALSTIKTNMQAHKGEGPHGPPPQDETDSTSDTDSTSSTSSTKSSTTADTAMSLLIAYLSNGSATTDSTTGSSYKAQA